MLFESKPVLEDISIVIPTLGRPFLEQSLFWILKGSAWPGCLIVVEQGSTPAVARWLIHVQEIGIRVKHIVSTQRGRSAGINRGLEQADTRFIAITDDDCFVGENWLIEYGEQASAKFRCGGHGAGGSCGRGYGRGGDVHHPIHSESPEAKFDSMSGGNMGTSLDVFRKVGLFEETL